MILARIVGPRGKTVREISLLLQSDEYPVGELPGWSNVDVENLWTKQWHLWNEAARSHAVPDVVDLLPESPDGGAPHLPPALYCKERRILFPAPCPTCGSVLSTCRDSVLLAEHGLPRYDASLERFLYCLKCHELGRPLRFYTLILSNPAHRASAPVGEQLDLYQAFAGLAHSGGPLPCAGCPSVPTCYPASGSGDVGRLLTPLSFFDFHFIPLERFRLTFGQFAALLGGDSVSGASKPSSRAAELKENAGAIDRQRRYLFEDDPGGKLPLEIFGLKLALCQETAAAVSRLHRSTRLPHLNLSPDNVLVDLPADLAEAPSYHSFRARLIGIGSATPRRLAGTVDSDEVVAIVDPPRLRDETYAASLVKQGPSRLHEGLLSLTSASELADGRCVIQSDLTAESFDVTTLGMKDVVEIHLRQGRPLPLALEFSSLPVRVNDRRVSLQGLPSLLQPVVVKQLASLVGEAPLRVSFNVHRCLHTPCDLESLGFLLFAALVANAEQGPGAVTDLARKISLEMKRMVLEGDGASSSDVEDHARSALQRAAEGGTFARRQIFHRPSAHADPRGMIPDSLWFDALLLGLRAVTPVPGFGLCRGHDDFDPLHPEGPVDHFRSELRILRHRLDESLLGMTGKKRVYSTAVQRVQHRLETADAE